MSKTRVVLLGGGLAVLALAAAFAWANLPYPPLPEGARADRVVVTKSTHRLELLAGGRVIATYRVAIGRHPVGPKRQEGDGHTPEGLYVVDYHNPASAFFRSLHVSYPNARDLAQARARGVAPGGSIMIHGLRPDRAFVGRLHRVLDWTNGCIALTNPEMAQVFRAVPDHTVVEIRP